MSFFGLAQYRNSVKMLPCPESRSILGWVIRQSGGAGRLWVGRECWREVSITLRVFRHKQQAGGLPSIDVTQTRAGRRSNVKPSLSEKAASHLPTGPHTNIVDAGQISSLVMHYSWHPGQRRMRRSLQSDIFLPKSRWCVCSK